MPWGDERIAVCMAAQIGRLRFVGRHHPAHGVLPVPLGPAEMPESDSSWPVGSTILPLHRSIKALIGVQRGATNTAHLKIFRQ